MTGGYAETPVETEPGAVLDADDRGAPGYAGLRHGRGRLFEVRGAQGARSWVFATIHDDFPTVTSLPRPVDTALSESRRLLMVVRPTPETLEDMRGRMFLPAGEDLEGFLGTELYAWVARTLDRSGIPDGVLRRWRPWLAIAALASTPPVGPDHLHQWLYTRARREGLTVHGLESAAERIARVDELAEADQIGLLRHVLQRREALPLEREARREAYLRGDLEALRIRWQTQLEALDRPLRQAFREHLGEGWMKRVVERAEPHLRAGGAFIALEGQHLAGPDGFLARLEARGFRVERRY
ncbi:MAG: TraB/GumN family protein [Pseudomonadota bacterium]